MLYFYPKLIQNKSRERYKVEVPLLHNSGLNAARVYTPVPNSLYTHENPYSFPL